MKNRTRKSQRLSKLLPRLLGPVTSARGLSMSRIISEWSEIAGDARTWSEPQSISFPPHKTGDGSLLVNVASGRGPEMQMMASEIIGRVNQLFGYRAVSRLSITQIAMRPKLVPREGEQKRAVTADEKRAFSAARRKIPPSSSPELREALDNLGKSLAGDKG